MGKKVGRRQSLLQVLTPDSVITHRPRRCEQCQFDFHQEVGKVKERRHIHDVPELRLLVQEHQIEETCCPTYQHCNQGSLPAGVDALAQYGPGVLFTPTEF